MLLECLLVVSLLCCVCADWFFLCVLAADSGGFELVGFACVGGVL